MGGKKTMEETKDDGALLATLGVDATAWATEFGTAFAGRAIVLDAADDDADKANAGTLASWFANAIGAGVTSRQTEVDGLNEQVDSLGKQLSDAIGERDNAAMQVSEGKSALEAMTRERDDQAGLREAAQQRIAALEDAASVTEGEQPAQLRSIGPIVVGEDDEMRAGYRKAIDAALAGDVEIVFSDGRQEIAGLKPVLVSGTSLWETRPMGRMLNRPIDVSGPAEGRGAYRIAGFGLLDDEGDQIGWCELAEPIVVGPLTRTQIRQSIIF